MGAEISFDPVLLDLHDDFDFFIIATALGEFARASEQSCSEFSETLTLAALDPDPLPIDQISKRAYVLLDEVERQIARNRAIRRSAARST